MEGLLSTKPTRSSFYLVWHVVDSYQLSYGGQVRADPVGTSTMQDPPDTGVRYPATNLGSCNHIMAPAAILWLLQQYIGFCSHISALKAIY